MTGPDDPFRVIADPTRRRMLDLLAERGSLTVGELAAEFPGLVASGISKHLMALRAAGLVRAEKRGRNQHYRIDPAGFDNAFGAWARRYESYWGLSLERLRALSEADPAVKE
ncbi:MAG: helix-turn-helix transcriptional regulator [Microlunatus sp.]|nr:helix-turn-helix transcriptional regulator [Microlunatus sp.]